MQRKGKKNEDTFRPDQFPELFHSMIHEQLCQQSNNTANGYANYRYKWGGIHTVHLQLRE